MGWLIALGIITLLAVLPLGVSVRYDEDGVLFRLIAGPVKITLFPRPKKEKKPKKEKPKKEKAKKAKPENVKAEKTDPETKPAAPATPAEEKKTEPEEQKELKPEQKELKPEKKSGGPITDFLPLVKTALDMLGAFRRRLRLNVLEVKVVLGGGDPCDLGLNYGRAWAAIGNLQPQLEKIFVIKKRKIDVECDFCADQTKITARLDLTITLGRILATVVVYGIRALIQFLKINKKRKGGAAK